MTTPAIKTTLAAALGAAALLLCAVPAEAAAGGKGPAAKIVTSAPVTVAGAGTLGTATATCPKGTVAVAGGFTTSIPEVPPSVTPHQLMVYESQRAGQRGWRVSGIQSFAASDTLSASAYCEPLKEKVKTRSVAAPLGPVNATVTAFATCPRGTKVISGGFAVPAGSGEASLVSRSIAGNGVGWVVDATRIAGAGVGSATSFAYCADVGKIKTRSASVAVLGSTGLAQTATSPVCPKKSGLRGGGFATTPPANGFAGAALVYASGPTKKSWVSSAVPSAAGTSSTLQSNGYCR